MVYYSRAIFSGRQKLIYTLAAILAVISVVYNPRIAEAVLIFSLTGAIPGTNIVLSPNMVLGLVVAVLVLGSVVLVARIKLRATRSRRNNHHRIPVRVVTERAIPVFDASEIAQAAPSIEGSHARPALRRKHKLRMFFSQVTRLLHDAATVIGQLIWQVTRQLTVWVVGIAKAIIGGFRNTAVFIGLAIVALLRGSRVLLHLTLQALIALFRILGKSAVAFWRFAQPYLWKLDTWLELQFRTFESYVRSILRKNESLRSLVFMSREYRKSVGELSPKLIIEAARKKITQAKNS